MEKLSQTYSRKINLRVPWWIEEIRLSKRKIVGYSAPLSETSNVKVPAKRIDRALRSLEMERN
jgi:hypothetical protein